MALIETVTIELGTSIAKSILKTHLIKSDIAYDASSTLLDILKSWAKDRTTQRRALRQFEDIGEQVGESLLLIFEMDGANLDEGSRTAVAIAVAETLNTASSPVLAQYNLAPTELARYLLEHPQGTEHFNETENYLYQRIITESCEYIVDIASQLPAFTERTFAEILKRENHLLDIAKQTLEDVHHLREQVNSLAGSPQFELEYRRAVVRKLDVLQLFGVDLLFASRRHRLSVAYVTLSVEQKPLPYIFSNKSITSTSFGEVKDEGDSNIVSVVTALSGSSRLLIRGMAGSGKTTLLQWIAVNSALKSFSGPLAKWNKTIPFYISLRSCMESALPAPEDFPKFISSTIANTMPKGWVHAALASGQALVLVDGLDEVSELRRKEVREWIKDLVEVYPGIHYFVTSRPNAIEEGWMDREGFSDAELLPMELSDIYAFIDHWHDAVREELNDEQEKAELPSFAQHLKEEVESSRPIRNLATNPLLCAMLCALNRERREQLPLDRIKLYEVCCEMLIERRDKDRRISLIDYPATALTYREKLVFLEELAYWMINNGWAQVELYRAEERFTRKLTNMHNIPSNISSVDVRRFFVERTSIIREPIVGRIDFTHRTFQEFLAAKAALNEGDSGVLIKNAHDYQWQEVIILASGLATRKVREELILELIRRGDTEKENRYQLHMLAVACLETTVELEPAVQEKVEARLSKLVPPKTMTDAKALAAAGEIVIKYLDKKHLPKKRKFSATSRAACVRTLAIIASDVALDILEEYADDSHEIVINELLKTWNAFDRTAYAKRILSRTLRNKSELHLEHLPSIDGLQYANLINLTKLDLCNCVQLKNIIPLASLTNLTKLVISGCIQLKGVTPLDNLVNLTELDLSGCSRLDNLNLTAVTSLTTLNLSGCFQLSTLNLTGLISLKKIILSGCTQFRDLNSLFGLTNLEILDLSDCSQYDSLSLISLTNLITLNLSNCSRLEYLSLTGLTSLTELNFSFCPRLENLSLTGLTSLTELDLSSCSRLSNLSLMGLTSLIELDLSSCPQLNDISPLANITSLTTLSLSHCFQICDTTSLTNLNNIIVLNLSTCPQIVDVKVANLIYLTTLNLSGCIQLNNLSLTGLTSLTSLDLSRYSQPTVAPSPMDFISSTNIAMTGFSGCPRLSTLNLVGLTNLTTLSLADCSRLSTLNLVGLTSLSMLNLAGCSQLSDLTSLATMTNLTTLNLAGCSQLSDLGILKSLISLERIILSKSAEKLHISISITEKLDVSYD